MESKDCTRYFFAALPVELIPDKIGNEGFEPPTFEFTVNQVLRLSKMFDR